MPNLSNTAGPRRDLIIRVMKVQRGVFKQTSRYRFVILGLNREIVAIGEDYNRIAALADAILLVTGVTILPKTGEHFVMFRKDGTYSISTRG